MEYTKVIFVAEQETEETEFTELFKYDRTKKSPNLWGEKATWKNDKACYNK